MKEGNILGHIVSKEGVKIDLERVEEIKQISFPRNKKEVQYFWVRSIFGEGLFQILLK
jgi:hypothetical protein